MPSRKTKTKTTESTHAHSPPPPPPLLTHFPHQIAIAARNAEQRLPTELRGAGLSSIATAPKSGERPLDAAKIAALLRRALEDALQPRLTFGAVDWARKLRVDYDEWIDEFQQRLRRELKREFIRRRKTAKELGQPTPPTPDYDAAVSIRDPRDVVAMDSAWTAYRSALILAVEVHAAIVDASGKGRADTAAHAAHEWLETQTTLLKL